MADKVCSVDGCEKKISCHGFCNMHSQRWRRHGDPLHVRPKKEVDVPTDKMCSIDKCSKPIKVRKYRLCNMHHAQFLREQRGLKCSIENCDQLLYAKGFCSKHYVANKTHGNPLINQRLIALKWIINIVKYPPDSCVLWPFSASIHGYGKVFFKNKHYNAHRLALVLFTGIDPDDKVAAHGPCHNPLCCNPLHLEWATFQKNQIDRIRDGTSIRGQHHPLSKLTEQDVLQIRSDPRINRLIAKDYNVCTATIRAVKRKATWKWLE